MIRKVVKSSWTCENGYAGFCYRVYYPRKENWRKDRVVSYTHAQNLPMTVLNFVLNAENCETKYVPMEKAYGLKSLKIETFTNGSGDQK